MQMVTACCLHMYATFPYKATMQSWKHLLWTLILRLAWELAVVLGVIQRS